MSNNNATTLGIQAVNKVRQSQVEAKASDLINRILANQKSIKGYQEQIVAEQKLLGAIADDVITQKDAIGSEFTPPLNPNQATILEVIKKMNEARQSSISLSSQTHINRIEQSKATIVNLEKQIAEWRKMLSELAVEVVTVEGITGSGQ